MAVLIFDYDGTIHDSMRIYAPAVRACHQKLIEEGRMPEGEITDQQIRSYLGLTAQEMWMKFAPHLSPEQHQEGSQFIYREMTRLALAGQAKLYDGALEVLQKLKDQGHLLVFLSNCSEGYRDLHTRIFGLDRYFDEIDCSEQFGWIPKWQIVQRLLPNWENEQLVIAIGDRYKDMEIRKTIPTDSKEWSVKTVFCSYGFGEAWEGQDADAVADSVYDIPVRVKLLSGS